MILIGIDDTDTLDTPGTNQLARLIASSLVDRLECLSIVRHQLFFDPRVRYTSKNGSASLRFRRRGDMKLADVVREVRQIMQEAYVEGSDPGLAVAEHVPDAIVAYAQRCNRELIDQREPRELAARNGVHLEGLGGDEGGVIGALAAVGLIATENDGRVIHWENWPDDLGGETSVDELSARRVIVRRRDDGTEVASGRVDLGKKLRPNLVEGRRVLWVEPRFDDPSRWIALKVA